MPSLDLIFRFLGVDAGAGAEFDRMGAKTSGLANKVGASTAAISNVAGATLLAGGAVAAVSVDMAGKFQAATEQIQTQADGTVKQVAKVRTGILQMAGAVASTPSALADAAYHIASVGKGSLTTAQQLNVLRVAAEGAKVGNADLTDVTNGLESAIVSGIKGAKNYSQAMGILNATVGAGDMHMQDLSDALSTGVVITAKQAGVSLQQLGAGLAVFGDNNIRGAKAGTQLRMSIQALEEPAVEGQAKLQALGISATRLATDMQHGGLPQAISDLRSHLQAAGDTGKKIGATLTDIFGKRAGAGIATLVGEYSRFQNKLKAVGDGGRNFASDWKDYTKTFGYSLDAAKSAGEALLITLGTDLLPVATKVMKWLATVGVPDLMKVAHWFEENKTAAAALGLGLVALWEPWVALGIVIVAAYKKSQTFRDVVHAAITGTIAVFHALVTAGTAVWHALDAAWRGISAGIDSVKADFAIFSQFWRSHSEEIKTVTSAAWKAISTVIKTQWQATVDMLRPALSLLKSTFKLAWDVIRTVVVTAMHMIADTVRTYIHIVLDSIGLVLDLITGKWAKAWSDAKKLVSDAFHGIASIISDFAKGALTLLYHAGRAIVHGLVNGIKSMASSVIGEAQSLASKVTSPFKKVLGILSPSKVFHGYGQNVVQGLVNGVKSKIVDASTVARLLAEGMIHGWTGAASRIKDALSTPIQNALSSLTTHLDNELSKQQAALKKAEQNYKTLIQARQQAITGLQQSIAGGADLTSLFGTDANGNPTVGNVGSYLQSQVGPMRQFAHDLKWAAQHHLSPVLLSQIANMGAVQGDQILRQFMTGQASITRADRAEALIQKYAKQSATITVESPHEKQQVAVAKRQEHHAAEMVAEQKKTNRLLERRAAHDVSTRVELHMDGKSFKLSDAEGKEIVKVLNRLGRQGVKVDGWGKHT